MYHEKRFTFRVRYDGLDYVFTADASNEGLAAVDLRSQCRAKGFNLHACTAEVLRVGRVS